MGVKKTYSKLFEFCDIKSWTSDNYSYYSEYYKEYKLEFLNGDACWIYKVYPANYLHSRGEFIANGYCSGCCHEGIVTLNGLGKIFCTLVLFFIFILIQTTIFKVDLFPNESFLVILKLHYKLYLGYIFLSYFISNFIYSIFNWKIYRILRKVEYVITHAKTIKEKEDQEILDQKIVSIVNNKVSSDPKLARRIKLKQLNKIPFWKKVGYIFDSSYSPLVDDE